MLCSTRRTRARAARAEPGRDRVTLLAYAQLFMTVPAAEVRGGGLEGDGA